AKIVDVPEIEPASRRVVHELGDVRAGIWENRPGGGLSENEIHIPGKELGRVAIARDENPAVVRQSRRGTEIDVADAAENGQSRQARSLVEVEGGADFSIELGLGQTHGLAKADQPGKIIGSFPEPNIKRSTILFLVVAEVREVGAD